MFFLSRLSAWWRARGRAIFRVRADGRVRHYDPVVVGTALERIAPDYQDLLQSLTEDQAKLPPGPVRAALADQQRTAAQKLATAARAVFALPPLDDTGGGVTDGEAVGVLTAYFLYMERLARAAELFRDSPDAGSASRPASTTAPSAASGTAAS